MTHEHGETLIGVRAELRIISEATSDVLHDHVRVVLECLDAGAAAGIHGYRTPEAVGTLTPEAFHMDLAVVTTDLPGMPAAIGHALHLFKTACEAAAKFNHAMHLDRVEAAYVRQDTA